MTRQPLGRSTLGRMPERPVRPGSKWWDRDPSWSVDLCWYGLLVAVGAVTAWAGVAGQRSGPVLGIPSAWVALLLLLLAPAPVLLRRQHPRLALVVAAAGLVGVAALGRDSSVQVTTLAVVLVAAVAADARLRPVPVFVLAAGAVAAASGLDAVRLEQGVQPSAFVFGTFGTALAIGLGLLLRRHREALVELAARNEELSARNAELQRLRVVERQRAVVDERTRIARELHDVVAHHVAGIAVRAGAARHVQQRRPEQAEAALDYVVEAAGETLASLRRMVGLLREPSTPAEVELDGSRRAPGGSWPDTAATDLAPQPTLDQLPLLLERQRAAGQLVTLHEQGRAVALPQDVQLAVYRIVQEALTNALQHAPGAPAEVSLLWEPGQLAVRIDNDLAPSPTTTTAERAAAGTGWSACRSGEPARGTLHVGSSGPAGGWPPSSAACRPCAGGRPAARAEHGGRASTGPAGSG
jgi:signal transduction histidine kinase